MKYSIYTEVQLTKNLPYLNFIKGDVATIVDVNENNGIYTYCLEFFDNNGNTLDVAIVSEDDIQKPLEHGVVNYRELQQIK